MDRVEEIGQKIAEVGAAWHDAGTLSLQALEALLRHARKRAIHYSAETGSGASTLLFSHLSQHHTVFALDGGSGSIENIRRSPLLRPNVVTFVEGPTQVTLPRHRFTAPMQAVLIDGPHGYPFPDLEYYFLYPHLHTGALLILDDIQIRSIHNLFEFLRHDAMFQLDEVVRTTAFFTRTEAPAFNPYADDWWRQAYNAKPLFRYVWQQRLKERLPAWLRRNRSFSALLPGGSPGCAVRIAIPRRSVRVAGKGIVEGSAALPEGSHLWVLVHRKNFDGWWPQGGGEVTVNGGRWTVPVIYGGPQDAGCEFEIAALVVAQATHEVWMDWVARVQETGLYPPVRLPERRYLRGAAYRSVTREA